MAYKFEIFKGNNGDFYWRFKSGNGEKMAGSEGYTTKASAKKAAETLKEHASDAKIEDLT